MKAMMQARKEDKEKDPKESLLGGMAEEIREIDWSAFHKVVGTTGVNTIIAGSSISLLTVNVILAKLFDKVLLMVRQGNHVALLTGCDQLDTIVDLQTMNTW